MTPRLLGRIAELVEAGATAVGPRPVKSPSLADYPACDDQVKQIGARLWGDCDGRTVQEHALGKGRVIWGKTPEQVLAAMDVPPDFACGKEIFIPARFIHRRLDDGTDVYFVANKTDQAKDAVCTFRVSGKRPELWCPETGRVEPAAVYQQQHGVTTVPLRLEPAESVFVVFRATGDAIDQITSDHVVSLARDGQSIPPALAAAPKTVVVQKAQYGVLSDPKRTLDVRARLQAIVDRGETAFWVTKMAEGGDPAVNIVKTLSIDYTVDGQPRHASGRDTEAISLLETSPAEHVADVHRGADGKLVLEAWEKGKYALTTSSGRKLACDVASLPAPQPIPGRGRCGFRRTSEHRKRLFWTSRSPGVSIASPASSIFPARPPTGPPSRSIPRRGLPNRRSISIWATCRSWPR